MSYFVKLQLQQACQERIYKIIFFFLSFFGKYTNFLGIVTYIDENRLCEIPKPGDGCIDILC